ncbi:hypothetical protein M422DRAFT_52534 [Sphaerobolus stellatus SS14]|uniref:Unplaced genomic scaffold SPHSTscaffold_141, whole genome shotgun sequence n=1 Tax=Sphaerobolus stellatus (strain SS14) TaxID=990650 RepID=A0A0C9V6W9_SPHS4|nr:hypothetical protein M422DRAFT_52534 [Sphaerobolus stellatus SS14]
MTQPIYLTLNFEKKFRYQLEAVDQQCNNQLRLVFLDIVRSLKLAADAERKTRHQCVSNTTRNSIILPPVKSSQDSAIHSDIRSIIYTTFKPRTNTSSALSDTTISTNFLGLKKITEDIIRVLLLDHDKLSEEVSKEKTKMAIRTVSLSESRAAAATERSSAEVILRATLAAFKVAEEDKHIAAREREKSYTGLIETKHLKPSLPILNISSENAPGIISSSHCDVALSSSPTRALSLVISGDKDQNLFLSCPTLSVPSISLLTPPRTPCEETHQSFPFNSAINDLSNSSVAVLKAPSEISVNMGANGEREEGQVSDLQVFVYPPEGINGALLQNPVGPYIRPPMSLDDMQKCIRCLLGKDKSLKTGNRARAFLGVPWSQIVTFDPDTLLQRGVTGIKPGSTGMASRLRMMTIIESALANQGNANITEELWEHPTHFCERCQQLYPITVPSNLPVPTFEEYEAIRVKLSLPNSHPSILPHMASGTTTLTEDKERKSRRRMRASRPGHLGVSNRHQGGMVSKA